MAQKEITLEDIFQKGTFRTKSVEGFYFRKDGNSYTTLEEEGIVIWDIASRAKKGLLYDIANSAGTISSIDAYELSSSEQHLLLLSDAQPLYRNSVKGQYFIWDLATKKLLKVSAPGPQRDATISPDGKNVAFGCANNLYYQPLNSSKRVQITSDGAENAIINGACDWVYEEEFSFARAYEWSPDGKYLAYIRFDERKVPTFSIDFFNDGVYPNTTQYKYPKVGEANAVVSVHIYDIAKGKTRAVPLVGNDFYVPRIKWASNNELCVFQMNRLQNELKLLLVNANSKNATRLLYQEKEEQYIDIHNNLTFLEDKSGFLWTSEIEGFNQLYYYDMQGKLIRKLTPNNFDLTDFYGFDKQRGLCHFQAAGLSALGREWYSVPLAGGAVENRIGGGGWNDFQFSPTFDYYVHTFSDVNHPTRTNVLSYDGTQTRELERNSAMADLQKEYNASEVTFFNVPRQGDRPQLNGWIMKPPGFDANKKYPVFMYLYGGPGSQEVTNQWGAWSYWWFQHLAQKGYIVACVDNRGTGARGEDFKKCTYKQLGKLETEDQIAAAQYLAQESFVDPARIGIFGWSYGGYMSSLCLFKGNAVFKMGMAVAPVTNWKWYDSIYTERYMQTEKENAAGYKENSPVYFADQLKGKYFLAHGMADDNVHFQNTAEMTQALLKANKQYDIYMYPNRNHGIYGGNARIHLYTKMTDFILENL